MSEAQTETPAPEGSPEEQKDEGSVSYPLALVKRETGRTHNVTGQGTQTILDADGNPETEYQLVATIDGAEIKLAGYNPGTIEHLIARAKANAENG